MIRSWNRVFISCSPLLNIFKKFEISDFNQKYKIDPVREFMKLKNIVNEEIIEENSPSKIKNFLLILVNNNNNLTNKDSSNFLNFNFFNKKEKLKKVLEESLQNKFEICIR